MEAATKNKRGRPDVFSTYYKNPKDARELHFSLYQGLDKRSLTNMVYCEKGWDIAKELGEYTKQYFWTDKGNWKAKGIAEQLGRMYLQSGFDIESCKDICKTALLMIDNGFTVKTIERWIRKGRNTNTW